MKGYTIVPNHVYEMFKFCTRLTGSQLQQKSKNIDGGAFYMHVCLSLCVLSHHILIEVIVKCSNAQILDQHLII